MNPLNSAWLRISALQVLAISFYYRQTLDAKVNEDRFVGAYILMAWRGEQEANQTKKKSNKDVK